MVGGTIVVVDQGRADQRDQVGLDGGRPDAVGEIPGVGGRRDSGEHEGIRDAELRGQRAVGGRAVTHDRPQLTRRDQSPDGIGGRGVRFARDLGRGTRGDRDRRHDGPRTGHGSVRRRERGVVVGPDEPGTGAHRVRSPGEVAVGQILIEPDDDGVDRSLVRHGDTAARQRLDDAVLTDDDGRRARSEHRRGDVGRGEEVVVGGGDATTSEAPVELGLRRCRVVGREEDPDAGPPQGGDGLVGSGDRPSGQPDHPVEIEDPRPAGRRRPCGRP